MGPKKKQSGGVRKSDGIHFVNARPSSETERLKAQRLVRAHVGQWISDHTKEKGRTTEEAVSSSRDTSADVSKEELNRNNFQSEKILPPTEQGFQSLSTTSTGSSCFTLASRPSPHPTRYITASRRLPPDVQCIGPTRECRRSRFPSSFDSDCSECSDDAEKIVQGTESVTIVPWNGIPRIEPQISANFDPFDTLAVQFPADVVNICESYCTYILFQWSGLFKPDSKWKL